MRAPQPSPPDPSRGLSTTKILRVLGLALFATLPLCAPAGAAKARASEPVAIVYSLAGEASSIGANTARQPLRLFDRLPTRTTVELAPGSRLALAFVTGKRYEISGPTRATLGKSDLSTRSGRVRPLPRIPPLPRLSPTAAENCPGLRTGAVRVRTERIEALRRALEEEGSAESLALLAEVDRCLGLLAEAREEFWAALQRRPEDTALAEALAELERRLAEESPGVGVVIEDVTPESLGSRVGLQAGDRLLSWCRLAASPGPCLAEGRFESPFDFDDFSADEAPRGGVMVLGKRGPESRVWALLPGFPSVQVHPVLSDDLLALFQEGRSLAAADRLDAAVERWRAAAVAATKTGKGGLGVWFLLRAANALTEAQKWPQADALYREAAEQARPLGAEKVDARVAKAWGRAFEKRGSWEEAQSQYRRALQLDRAAGRDVEASGLVHQLGSIAAQRGDLQEAEALLEQALAIRQELAPHSVNLARTLMNLGLVSFLRGNLAAAEGHLRRALPIEEGLAPGSLETANVLQNLAIIASERGNLAGAEDLYRRAKAIYERISPDSLAMAKLLNSLSDTVAFRYDDDTAEHFLQRALAIAEKVDANGMTLAFTLRRLGNRALQRGDLEKAEGYFHRAMSLAEKVTPEGPALASPLDDLGDVALRRRDCATAEAFFQRALAIRQRLNPDSLEVSHSLKHLGDLDLECGDLAGAEDHFRQALAIRERLAPGAIGHAMVLYGLGEVHRRRGRALPAEELTCQAAEISEQLSFGRTGGYDEQLFSGCLRARVEIGRIEEAFHVLERGRARAFLEQLTERDLLFSSDLPEGIARRRRLLAKELESTQEALDRLQPAQDAAEAERLLHRLRDIRDRQRELVLEIRKSSPHFASLQYPEPLDLAGARRALDPGTVLLSYAVGEEKSYLFAVHPPELPGPGLSVFPLPITRKALQQAVASFRSLLQDPGSDAVTLTSRSTELYDLLIGPAEAWIAPAERLLISANGPLHTLPFAALARKDRYLIEWKPIHSVLSATVYAELRKERRPSADPEQTQVVAFGDPAYPRLPKDQENAPAATLEVLTAVRRGLSLDPIPATRGEVKAIASLFPGTRIYLGPEATEEQAKTIGSQARLVHFACHGVLNERSPLDSALALTIPENPGEGQENGLLQAWEIFESVRLDAELVTLSACDSALGQELGGEGLVGLTRAFQHAGARSVLASLWGVADISTARLMKRFYAHLRDGKTKDEALRAAQVDQIREGARSSHPFHWAAFQLFGDWR
ncbi:MAG TPA: CHAT domain-containing protein [Thermoanaerobaculia bacterium]|nr:CHAT domain-containing protein [Thermoanaerobaculia bacterium]